MQEISIFVILKATSTDRQTRRLHIFKTFCIYLASDNTLIILVFPTKWPLKPEPTNSALGLPVVWSKQNQSISSKICCENNHKIRRFLTDCFPAKFAPKITAILSLKIPPKFAFFCATYHKPCYIHLFSVSLKVIHCFVLPATSCFHKQLMNEAEYLMKNYGDRGGCYPPFFVFTIKTTQPRPQVFSVNGALTCTNAAFLTSFPH